MNRMTSTTIAALLVAAIGAGVSVPVMAQDQGPREDFAARGEPDMKRHIERRGPEGHGFLALVCAPDGADRLQHMLLSVAQQTDPTGEQVALYDAFKSTATTAQADFAATCAAARPAEDATANRNLIDNLNTRLEIEEARVAAMNAVIPAFEAFYNSLGDAQKTALEPRDRDGRRGERGLHREHRGPGGEAPSMAAPLNG